MTNCLVGRDVQEPWKERKERERSRERKKERERKERKVQKV